MKKSVLILLCFPLIFSCGDKKDKKDKDIQGYWNVTVPGDDNPSIIFHFAEDGFFCSDVNIGSSCRDNRDKINNCDDCMSDNNWKYSNDKETQISIKAGKRKRDQLIMEANLEKETEDRYILSFRFGPPGDFILERTSFKEIKDEYNRNEDIEELVEEAKLVEESESYYGTINDSDGYTNVRSDKSSRSDILFKVYLQQEFEIIDSSDHSWWLIEYEGTQGYMYSDKIDLIP